MQPVEPGSNHHESTAPPKMNQQTRYKVQSAWCKLRTALRTVRGGVKYLGYSIRYAISAALTWASEHPMLLLGTVVVIIGGIILIAVPEVGGTFAMVFGFSAVGPMVSGLSVQERYPIFES